MLRLRKLIFFAVCMCFVAADNPGCCYADGEFQVDAGLRFGPSGETQLVVHAALFPGQILYADEFQISLTSGVKVIPVSLPVPQREKDAFSGEEKFVYKESFTAVYLVEGMPDDSLNVKIAYQGCDKTTCFLPASREFRLKLGSKATSQLRVAGPPAEKVGIPVDKSVATACPAKRSGEEAERDGHPKTIPLHKEMAQRWLVDIKQNYEIVAVQSGYMGPSAFLNFLEASSTNKAQGSSVQKIWQSGKIWLSVFLIVLGGLALNLTPCVLPLIPVNLAIIGAGRRAASPGQGFINGAFFGVGMALAYGALGLLTVLTGAQFGALNASPWFNIAVAVIFFILGLSLLDVIVIDFSSWQSRIRISGTGPLVVMLLGALSAVLAGACVAPVVIAVLLLATDLYLKGQHIGLVIPFFLGLGMALPWPFAGAFAFLPKPGKWMVRVKQAFAAVILFAALYYGYQGGKLLFQEFRPHDRNILAHSDGEWLNFPDGMNDAKKPVLLYFWATWCKNCTAMSYRTFRDARVLEKMKDFTCVKFQAENPDDETTGAVLREFSIMGLPSYVIMRKKDGNQ